MAGYVTHKNPSLTSTLSEGANPFFAQQQLYTGRIKWGATKGRIHFCGERASSSSSALSIVRKFAPALCRNQPLHFPPPLLCPHCCPEISLAPSPPPRLTAGMQMLSFPLFCWLTAESSCGLSLFSMCTYEQWRKAKGGFSFLFFLLPLLLSFECPLIRVPFHPSQQVAVRE